MKKIILSLLLFQTYAFASYFQIHCSNASGTLTYNTGHAKNNVTIGDQTYNLRDGKIKENKAVTISKKTKNSCKPGDSSGIAVFDTYSYTQMSVKVINEDIAIKDFVICHNHVNNMVPCIIFIVLTLNNLMRSINN